MRAFRSEWIKLSRRNTLLGFGGAMIGFTLLFTFMAFMSVRGTDVGLQEEGAPAFVTKEVLSLTDGALFPLNQVAIFLGIIALALFASSIAGEFNRGTVRMLFVTEPNRVKLLAGKLTALASFVAIGVAATLLASVGLGAALAAGAGVDTAAWWTAEAATAMASAYVNVTGSALVTALIGGALALLTRSAAIAISIGAAYFILGEALVSAFWKPLAEWGPAAVTNALVTSGEAGTSMGAARPAIGLATAALLAAGYGLLSIAVGSTVLAKRDVTS